jgi:glycosyltransferase involved in cell wall biosynthesis
MSTGGRATTPLISIVTPTLNQAAFIEATINSIKAQSWRRFEHIVVDGGSTDGTLEILAKHEATYPLRWISEPDGGMYEAINKGLRLATGEILAYLNSDDLYFPWTLETIAAAFDRDPAADFVYGDALSVDDETGAQEFYWTLPFNLGHLRTSGFLAQPAVFWRRSAYESIGPFDEGLRYVADCDYWMRAGATHSFKKVNEFLAIERDHASTQRRAAGSGVWDELALVRARYGHTPHPQRGVARPALRESLWRRIYFLWFLIQSLVPASVRRGPWRRILAAEEFQFSRLRLLGRTLPIVGGRFAGQVITPSRRWLDPPP